MKIFIDSADTDVIKSCFKTGLVDGLTTNPSLIRKSGKKHEDVYQELKDIGLNDISMEVIGSKENMISEGKRLHKKFGKCATIKVPCTPDGLMACVAIDKGLNETDYVMCYSCREPLTKDEVRSPDYKVDAYCPYCVEEKD